MNTILLIISVISTCCAAFVWIKIFLTEIKNTTFEILDYKRENDLKKYEDELKLDMEQKTIHAKQQADEVMKYMKNKGMKPIDAEEMKDIMSNPNIKQPECRCPIHQEDYDPLCATCN